MSNTSNPNPIVGRPIITNIDPMFVRVNNTAGETTVTIQGHGFWDNRDKIVDGIKHGQRVPFYNKKSIDRLRLFVVPHPAGNRSDQYNIFDQPLSAYNLYEPAGEPMVSKYPAFTGVEIIPDTKNQNLLTFELPPALSSAFVDIIIANRAGYSRASTEPLQSSDQHTVNLTTESIASSGMIMVAEPTFIFSINNTTVNKINFFDSLECNYKQTLLFDSFYDKESLLNKITYTYQLATDPGMSNITHSISSKTFSNTVVFAPVVPNTKYYNNLIAEHDDIIMVTNTTEQSTKGIILSAIEPDEVFFNELTFEYYISEDTVPDADWRYILATDRGFENIITTRAVEKFVTTQTYINLAPRTTYYSAVSSARFNSISNIVSASTNPCDRFVVDLKRPTTTYTIEVTARSTEKIFVTEVLSDNARGMVQPIANDDRGNLFIAVGEGFFRPDRGNTPGKLVFDGGWPKFYGYVHEHMPINSLNGRYVSFPGYWSGTVYQGHEVGANWTRIYRDMLDKGHSIYNASIFPGEFAYLCNAFKYIQRKENPTGKILYINDFRNNDNWYNITDGETWPAYGVARFYSTFYDIAKHAGMEMEQLSGGYIAEWGDPKHDLVLEGKTPGLSALEQWRDYLANYDAVIWAGVNYNGEPRYGGGYVGEDQGKNNYVSPIVIQALEDFYDDGGGLYISTDHNYFQGCVQPVVSSYGIKFCCHVNRKKYRPAYKIENILNNKSYIPDGRHPLFDNLEPGSYIYAGGSEGAITYVTGSGRLMINSEYTTSSDGTLFINQHNDGSLFTTGRLQVKSAGGCVSAFNI